MKHLLITGLLLALAVTNVQSQGTILWNEAVNGALSQSSSAPTQLPILQLGTNTVIGTSEIEPLGNIWIAYADFFVLQVPENSSLSAVYVQLDHPNVWHWIGSPSFDARMAFIMNPTNGELLDQWGVNTIGAGTYGMYVGNSDAQPTISVANYRLDFVVVPEPSALALALAGAAGLLGLHQLRRKR